MAGRFSSAAYRTNFLLVAELEFGHVIEWTSPPLREIRSMSDHCTEQKIQVAPHCSHSVEDGEMRISVSVMTHLLQTESQIARENIRIYLSRRAVRISQHKCVQQVDGESEIENLDRRNQVRSLSCR